MVSQEEPPEDEDDLVPPEAVAETAKAAMATRCSSLTISVGAPKPATPTKGRQQAAGIHTALRLRCCAFCVGLCTQC